MKTLIVRALVLVLLVRAGAGFFRVRKGGDPATRDARMAWALALRVALSITVFLLVLLGWGMGWIHPTGLPTGH